MLFGLPDEEKTCSGEVRYIARVHNDGTFCSVLSVTISRELQAALGITVVGHHLTARDRILDAVIQ